MEFWLPLIYEHYCIKGGYNHIHVVKVITLIHLCLFCFSARGTSELFGTCSEQDIKLWHIGNPKELLCITVPNMTCNAMDFMANGQSIISGESLGRCL